MTTFLSMSAYPDEINPKIRTEIKLGGEKRVSTS